MRKPPTTRRPPSRISRLCLAARAGAAAAVVLTAPMWRTATAHAQAVLDLVEVAPTGTDFPGGSMVQKMINWAGQFGLWGSVASLLIGAGIWGVSQQFGNGYQAGKGKTLAGAGAVGAVLTGLAAIIVNTLYNAAGA